MKNDLLSTLFDDLVYAIECTINSSKGKMSNSINSIMTETYWQIGKYIVEFEQSGNEKATYGKALLTELSKALTLRLGRGYSRPNLNNR